VEPGNRSQGVARACPTKEKEHAEDDGEAKEEYEETQRAKDGEDSEAHAESLIGRCVRQSRFAVAHLRLVRRTQILLFK
jgi:hypothetical protein